MKKVLVNCCALLLMTFMGCQKETINTEETAKKPTKEIEIEKGRNNSYANDQGNELVILYPEGTTEAEKILKRAEYTIEEYKKCECADPNLELWVFGRNEAGGGGLEEKKEAARADEEIEGAEFNPNIKIQEEMFVDYGAVANVNQGLPKRVASNQGITVAVLDTGIMYDYGGFTTPFLYNSTNDACTSNGYNELFGWNFVEDTNNPYDDYPGRHGTIVTQLITSKLNQANINHQILPVKVANNTGDIRYFDALCGFQYAAKKPDVKIINMSFGWYYHERELLQKFIDDVANNILVITSAGNHGINNDQTAHYPSSYESDNILAIASLRGENSQSSGGNSNTNTNVSMDEVITSPNYNPYNNSSHSGLADFSNRGTISVDIAAQGENIPFVYSGETFYVHGTSYSAALTTGFAGSLYQSGMSATTLKTTLINNSISSPSLTEIQYSKHIPE